MLCAHISLVPPEVVHRSASGIDRMNASIAADTVVASSPFTCAAVVAQVVSCTNTLGALGTATSATITVAVTVSSTASNPMVNRAKVGTTGADPQNSTTPTSVTAALCTGVDVPNVGCATDSIPLNADLQIYKSQRIGTPTNAFQTTLLGASLNDTV